MILTAITLIIQLLPGLLQSFGVISPAISKLISDLGSAIPGAITALATGKTVPDDVMTVLKGFQDELTALKQDTNLSPHALGTANTLILALNNGLSAYTAAGRVTDPSTLIDLPENLQLPAPVAPPVASPAEVANQAADAAHAAAATATAAAVSAQAAAIAASTATATISAQAARINASTAASQLA